jgi:preprotein translocase subunit SecG
MPVIKGLLIVIEVATSVLLIGVILLQKAKDEGLGLAFGAGVGETLFGSRAGNVLTKITIGLATVFLVNTMLIDVLMSGDRRGTSSSITDSLPSTPAGAPAGQQAMPEGGTLPSTPAETAPVDVPAPQSAPAAAPLSTPVSVPVPSAP